MNYCVRAVFFSSSFFFYVVCPCTLSCAVFIIRLMCLLLVFITLNDWYSEQIIFILSNTILFREPFTHVIFTHTCAIHSNYFFFFFHVCIDTYSLYYKYSSIELHSDNNTARRYSWKQTEEMWRKKKQKKNTYLNRISSRLYIFKSFFLCISHIFCLNRTACLLFDASYGCWKRTAHSNIEIEYWIMLHARHCGLSISNMVIKQFCD